MREHALSATPTDYERAVRRGWALALLVLGGLAWVAMQHLPPVFVAFVGGLAFASGYWSGRRTYWHRYATDHLGISIEPNHEISDRHLTWIAVALAILTFCVISLTWRHAVAAVVIWWGGVLAVTVTDVRAQERFEKFIASLPISSQAAGLRAAREYATGPTFSLRHRYPKLVSAVTRGVATN